MLKKRLTFLVIPDSSQVARQLSIPVWALWSGLAGMAVLVVFCFFFASRFFSEQVKQAEMTRLKTENQRLATKYEEIRWSLAETDARYGDLVQKEIALRSFFGLPEISFQERLLGVGGPDPLIVQPLSKTEQLAFSTEAEVDRLLRLSQFELEKYSEAEAALTTIKDRLDHTPSVWPANGWTSRGFGMRFDPFTGYKQFHRGIDIANHTGTPIIATAGGRVREIGTIGQMGKTVVIDHGHGYITRYGHLSKIEVKRGQVVGRGDLIGRMGSTGYSTGPHLHYEVWQNGKVLNPAEFIINYAGTS